MFKILNYFFLLLFLFVSKQIIFKSDIYVLKIIENKSNIDKYFDNDYINYLNDAQNSSKKTKLINSFLDDKYRFYYHLSIFSELMFSGLESYEGNYNINNLRIINTISSHPKRDCFLLKQEKFIILMNACSSYGPSFLRNTNLFEDKDGYKVLVKDNSEYNLTFEFYEELIRYINKGFSNEFQETQMPLINFIDIKKEDYKFIFFLEKILIIFLYYLLSMSLILIYKNES